MDATLAISRNGLTASDKRQEVISNNLANASVDGFKAKMVDQMTLQSKGTHVSGVREDLINVGAPRKTDQPGDFYIRENGFFQVQLPDQVGYTRSGSFTPDADGNLRSASGHLMEPNISVPENSKGIRTSADGRVYNITPEGTQEQIGQLEIVRFINPSGLESVGENNYVQTVASGDPRVGTPGDAGFGTVLQGYVEGSNVDATTELTDLLINQRYHQFNLRVFQTTDSLLGRAVDLFS